MPPLQTLWNPVKELKAPDPSREAHFRRDMWNPVKELKVDGSISFPFRNTTVESGEGIESEGRPRGTACTEICRGIR